MQRTANGSMHACWQAYGPKVSAGEAVTDSQAEYDRGSRCLPAVIPNNSPDPECVLDHVPLQTL
jgi:hypothetical protein